MEITKLVTDLLQSTVLLNGTWNTMNRYICYNGMAVKVIQLPYPTGRTHSGLVHNKVSIWPGSQVPRRKPLNPEDPKGFWQLS